MNCNNFYDEEFQNSEAWLSEQIFSQLKDFNKPTPKNDVEPNQIQNEIQEETESAKINSDIVDLEAMKYQGPPPQVEQQQQVICPILKTPQEQSIPLDVENQEKNPNLFAILEQPFLYSQIVKCANCNCVFLGNTFNQHICDYGEDNKLIVPEPTDQTLAPFEPGPVEPSCIRLLRENQIRIRRFLKDELKYDLDATSSSNNTVNKKQNGPHECNLCERKFVHASGLSRHMEKHALDLIPTTTSTTKTTNSNNSSSNGLRVVIKCTICGRLFFEPQTAFQHFCVHFPEVTDKEESTSEAADAEFPYESYVDEAIELLKKQSPDSQNNKKLAMHLQMVILSCILQCEFCDMIFSQVSYLFAHSACHSPDRHFECSSCEIQVGTSKEIFMHWQAECVFSRENLKRGCSSQRFYVCNVCENKFGSLESLHEHRYTAYHFFPRKDTNSNLLLLPCEYCDRIFQSANEIVEHFEEKHCRKNKRDTTTTKYRQYLCDICGKTYTQSSHLWQHLRFHKGVKPFACKEPGCLRKFTIRPDLNDHIRKCHTGERPYHCLICGRRFLTGSVFYQHRLIHRGERRYGCDECGKRFYRADALKNHHRIHTGEKPFGCLFCTKNFRQRGDRDKHIRARHSSLDANARLMMQLRKMQLEATARAGAGGATLTNSNPTSSEDVLMVGNIPFPRSMFQPLLPDIDGTSAAA
ncbi:testis-specific zinc finger protein topi isoform X2 [Eupeodes corollae]|uniref:testis-specific zinc finger protein topi isoform X2 n=1 Tax=Eupeodes corollae TaxID=290404 RepID=UPI00249291B6|nr:testis-specific zinc finger protein topi isoform X2 [Eupeodes corollae]